MPRFPFKGLSLDQDLKRGKYKYVKILLDGINYFEKGEFHEVKKLQFTSKNGIIIIDGLFDLSNKDILNLIKLDYLNIIFSKELKESFKLKFDKPKISIHFYLTQETIDIIKNNINKLKQKFKNIDTDYKTFIKLDITNFTDINILSFLKDSNIDDVNKGVVLKHKNEKIDEYNLISNMIIENEEKKENYKDEEEEEIITNPFINNFKKEENKKIEVEVEEKKEEYEEEEKKELEDEDEEIINPFIQEFKKEKEEKKEKKQIQKVQTINKSNYIKINKINDFIFPDNSNINISKRFRNNIIYKYIPKNKNLEKLNVLSENNLKFALNINNTYPILKTDDNKNYTIEFRNININEELKDLKEIYQNDILLNFITLIIDYNNYNDHNNPMTINDYTFILLSFIKNIEKAIIDSKKNIINNDKKYNYYTQRMEQIISTLKLFHILFLNCFITKEKNKLIDYDELFDNYSSKRVQTMRKKMLVEWCMSEEKNYINKNDLININKAIDTNILSKQIISFGQIKTAINSNKNKNLFLNAKLSNLSKDNSYTTFSYFMKKQNKKDISNSFISYEAFKNNDKITNNWVSFLLQSLLYIENSNEYIIKSIKNIEEKIKDMKDISKPYMLIKNNEKEILQLNYLLLKIYEKLMEGNDEDNDEESEYKLKDIKNIEIYINMLSNNNLFNSENSDHFIQYIILFLFTKIINFIFPNIKNSNILIKKNYFLLNLLISEIISNKNNTIYNLILIMKLLYTANINRKLKQKIFIDIISHQNLDSIQMFWDEYDKEKESIPLINDDIREFINGIYYMNKCNWYEAYKSFFKSKKYDFCMNSYINYCFYLINETNINEINFKEIYNNLYEILKIEPSLFYDFYDDFYQLISFIVNKDESDYEDIIKLLQKYIKEYDLNNKILNLNEKNHRMIIKLLYKILLLKDEQDNDLILGGDEGILKLNNILFEDKKCLLKDVLKDIIEHKNIEFSIQEQ